MPRSIPPRRALRGRAKSRRVKGEEGDDEQDEDMPGDDEAETVGRGEEPDLNH